MIKVDLDELKAAISELEARSKPGSRIDVQVDDRKLLLSCSDRNDNTVQAILYNDRALGAEFKLTERLMFMKDKKRL